MRNFRNIKVWEKSHELTLRIYGSFDPTVHPRPDIR
jgi:hypothetical protein